MTEALTRFPLLDGLPMRVRQALASQGTVQQFRKGQTVFEEGQLVEAVWLVRRGCVYLIKRTGNREPITVFLMTPEESLCGISALGYRTYSVGAMAATAAELIRIPRDLFLQLVETYPKFASAVLLSSCTRLRHMADSIAMARASVEQRVAYVLLRLRSSFGDTIPITHHELARMAGTRWETSIRTIAAMKQRRWVASRRGTITVLRPRQLQTLTACSPRS